MTASGSCFGASQAMLMREWSPDVGLMAIDRARKKASRGDVPQPASIVMATDMAAARRGRCFTLGDPACLQAKLTTRHVGGPRTRAPPHALPMPPRIPHIGRALPAIRTDSHGPGMSASDYAGHADWAGWARLVEGMGVGTEWWWGIDGIGRIPTMGTAAKTRIARRGRR